MRSSRIAASVLMLVCYAATWGEGVCFGQEQTTICTGLPRRVSSIAFSPDGKHVVAGCLGGEPRELFGKPSSAGQIFVWETATGKVVWKEEARYRESICQVSQVFFDPDGKRIWVQLSADGGFFADNDRLVLWNWTNKEVELRKESYRMAEISPDGRRLVMFNRYRNYAWVVDANTFNSLVGRVGPYVGPKDVISYWSVDWKTRRAAFAYTSGKSPPGRIYLCDLENGKLLTQVDSPGTIKGLAFSPDGQRLAIVDGEGAVRIWSEGKQELEGGAKLNIDVYEMHDFRFAPDGKHLVGMSKAGDVTAWEAETGKRRFSVDAGKAGTPTHFTVSSNGELVAIGCKNGSVLIARFR